MKALSSKYLFLPLIVLFCGVYQVSAHKTDYEVLHVSTGHQSHPLKYFSKESRSKSSERPAYEIIEQTTNTFQKDLVGDASFAWLALKDCTYSVLDILSEQLSLRKPLLIPYSGEALYLVIRILRL
ncbi:MAG: hypothetical protein KF870_04150 [Leadbetterella sp.]|nr:hypothetical protein [Leadbetterella sp.]